MMPSWDFSLSFFNWSLKKYIKSMQIYNQTDFVSKCPQIMSSCTCKYYSLKMFIAKVDLRYTVWLFWDYDKGYIWNIKSGGYLVVSNLYITILLSMVILRILLIWFHHMDTILVVLLVCLNLTLYLKLHYRMRTFL